MHDSNVIGPMVAKLRCQRNWSQQLLAAKMQVKGFDITRDVIANIESRRSVATDEHIILHTEKDKTYSKNSKLRGF